MADFTQTADAKQFRVTHASRVSGEHTLPACSCRRPCRQHPKTRSFEAERFSKSRQAVETRRLAACAPQMQTPYLEIFPSALISFFNTAPTRCRARYTWPTFTPNRSATFCAGHSLRT